MEIKEYQKSAIIVTHDIEEAVGIADKVIILSKRPSHIIKEIRINRNNLNYKEFRKTKEFLEYTNMIWEILENEE